jgi:hypothetical protein
VRQASCPSGQRKADYFDSKQRGFLIEIRCSGRKTYYQRYCDERGRERQFKIGRGDVLTAEQARRAARSILARAVLGENPQLRRQELRSIPSLAEFVAEKYLPFVNEAGAPTRRCCASMSCPRSAKWRSTRSRPSTSSR